MANGTLYKSLVAEQLAYESTLAINPKKKKRECPIIVKSFLIGSVYVKRDINRYRGTRGFCWKARRFFSIAVAYKPVPFDRSSVVMVRQKVPGFACKL
jgi:hypothetical protein